MKPITIHVEQSDNNFLTNHGGLTLSGQAIKVARLAQTLKTLSSYRGIGHHDMLSTYVGLVSLDKTDSEATENVRLAGTLFQRTGGRVERLRDALMAGQAAYPSSGDARC